MVKVVVLEGNRADRKGELNKIKHSLVDHELFIFDKEDEFDHVSQMISEMSCFGNLRLFIIKELPNIDAPDASQARSKVLSKFKKMFQTIPSGNVVVFDNIGLSSESFFKEVSKVGKVFKFGNKMTKTDAVRKVNSLFTKNKIDFESDTTSLIVDSLNMDGTDVDIDKFYILMQKVYTYVAHKSKITKDDVLSVCDTSKDFIVWNLYNLLDEKNFCKSLNLVTDYLNNVKNFQFEADFLLKGMAWKYGLLLMAKNGINDNSSKEKIVEELSSLGKIEVKGRGRNMCISPRLKDGNKIQEYSKKMINNTMGMGYGRSSLSCYAYDQLLLIYYALVKTQIKIRSGCTDSEVMIAIQMIFLVICSKITKKNTIDGILEHKKMIYRGL